MSDGVDRLLGNGLRTQIANALEQTGRFTVVNNAGPREVLQRGMLTPTGTAISARAKERLGSFGDAEFLVAGRVTTYQLSKESKAAGVEADLLFREAQASTIAVKGIVETAKREFNSLKPVVVDRVEYELWLFDAKSGNLLSRATIEGTPNDSSEIGGPFGQQLSAASSETVTPMQRVLRVGAIHVVNWIAETQDAFRAGTLIPPSVPPVVKTTPEPSGEEQKSGALPTRKKSPSSRVHTPQTAEKVEENVPVTGPTAPPQASGADWGSPAKDDGGGKSSPQSPEEWGEK